MVKSMKEHSGKVNMWIIYVELINLFKGLIKRRWQNEELAKTTTATNLKCKECGMQFQNKDNLQIHKKKAHSGRGEKKKKA